MKKTLPPNLEALAMLVWDAMTSAKDAEKYGPISGMAQVYLKTLEALAQVQSKEDGANADDEAKLKELLLKHGKELKRLGAALD